MINEKDKMNKKAQGRSFWIIITAIIALVVVVLIIMWFSKGGGKAFEEIEGKISSLGDCDGDGIANMFDKCPCNAVVGEENPAAVGCPLTQGPTECGPVEKENCEKCGKLTCP